MHRGAFILGCQGPALSQDERAFFAEADPWGFILFARNVEAPDQLRRLTSDLREAAGWNCPILIDQEGGRVQRLGPPHWRAWMPPLEQMAKAPARAMALRYALISAELRDVGIDVNCAPVADIARGQTHAVLRNRCYASAAADVAKIARLVADAHLAGGVLPVVKHMPGHGLATLDSHLDLPHIDKEHGWLAQHDFAPFRDLSDLPIAMSAHIVFDRIDPGCPATLSPRMIELIRDEIGFGGLLLTDDISMQALSGTPGERGAAALAAGCDIVLHCNGDMSEMAQIAELGQMTEAAAERANRALGLRISSPKVDIPALEAEFRALVPEVING